VEPNAWGRFGKSSHLGTSSHFSFLRASARTFASGTRVGRTKSGVAAFFVDKAPPEVKEAYRWLVSTPSAPQGLLSRTMENWQECTEPARRVSRRIPQLPDGPGAERFETTWEPGENSRFSELNPRRFYERWISS